MDNGQNRPAANAEPVVKVVGLNHYFGERFTHLFSTVKRAEAQEFNSHVTPLEIARYLGPL